MSKSTPEAQSQGLAWPGPAAQSLMHMGSLWLLKYSEEVTTDGIAEEPISALRKIHCKIADLVGGHNTTTTDSGVDIQNPTRQIRCRDRQIDRRTSGQDSAADQHRVRASVELLLQQAVINSHIAW